MFYAYARLSYDDLVRVGSELPEGFSLEYKMANRNTNRVRGDPELADAALDLLKEEAAFDVRLGAAEGDALVDFAQTFGEFFTTLETKHVSATVSMKHWDLIRLNDALRLELGGDAEFYIEFSVRGSSTRAQVESDISKLDEVITRDAIFQVRIEFVDIPQETVAVTLKQCHVNYQIHFIGVIHYQ